jgi:heme/copper-type cytochrome/quinol oxidase subunit 3
MFAAASLYQTHSNHSAGSHMTMYILTGLHGSHVFIGVTAIAGILSYSSSTSATCGSANAVQNGTHLYDLVHLLALHGIYKILLYILPEQVGR